jgi:hypothetical protein
MLATALEAKAALEAEGLQVSVSRPGFFLIAGSFRDSGCGLRLSNDACILMCNGDESIASFPGKGLSGREIPGSLDDLVALILAVYAQYNEHGQGGAEPFRMAVERLLGEQTMPMRERPMPQARTAKVVNSA